MVPLASDSDPVAYVFRWFDRVHMYLGLKKTTTGRRRQTPRSATTDGGGPSRIRHDEALSSLDQRVRGRNPDRPHKSLFVRTDVEGQDPHSQGHAPPLGPYPRPMPRVLGCPRGVGVFLWARYPCTNRPCGIRGNRSPIPKRPPSTWWSTTL